MAGRERERERTAMRYDWRETRASQVEASKPRKGV